MARDAGCVCAPGVIGGILLRAADAGFMAYVACCAPGVSCGQCFESAASCWCGGCRGQSAAGWRGTCGLVARAARRIRSAGVIRR